VRTFVFHDDDNEKFTESGLTVGVAFNEGGVVVSGMRVDFRNMDTDGKPDLFITALSNEIFPLYRGVGDWGFRDVTSPSSLGVLSLPWGVVAAGANRHPGAIILGISRSAASLGPMFPKLTTAGHDPLSSRNGHCVP
jgi:hypothetical protein